MKIIKYFLLSLFLFSCAQVTSLNLRKHQFGKIPTKIIWIQFPGFDPEHVALLKYSYPTRDRMTAFEESLCSGTIWDYSLYQIRPNSTLGTLAQLTGKKNVKGECSDYKNVPIWKYVGNKNYKVGIFEGELSKEQSLLNAKGCKEGENYLDEVAFWSMSQGPAGAKSFHVDDKKKYDAADVYYDRSCSKGNCYTTFSKNVQEMFENYTKNSKNYLFVVRNFKYQNLIKKNDILKAKIELEEVNATLKYFQNLASKSSDMLVILSGAEAINIDFPLAGKEWKVYEEKARYIKSINSKLVSPIYASGARAENFCGVYEQGQVLSRIFSGAKQQGLEFSIINPFE